MLRFIIDYNDTIIPAIVLIIFVLVRPRVSGPYLYLLGYLCLLIPLLGYSNILADKAIHNVHLYHILTMVDSFFILSIINKFSLKPFRHIRSGIVIFISLAVLNGLFLEHFYTEFNRRSSSLLNLIVSVFCFRYFIQLAKDDEVMYFQKLPGFWIVSGFLFYGITSALILANYTFILGTPYSLTTWQIQEVANMIRFVLISVGLICYYKQRNSPSGSMS